jgi:DNA-binding XRE family transcriptional regulator
MTNYVAANSGTGTSVLVDLTRLEDASFKRAVKDELANLGLVPRVFAGFWKSLASGQTEEVPTHLVVMADLARLVAAFNHADLDVWRSCVRQRHPFFVAFVRSRSDEKSADLVDDLFRASEHRLWVYSVPGSSTKPLRDCLSRFVENLDPEAVIDVRFSDTDRTVWIEFADGLRRALAWSALALDDAKPPLRPETIRIGEHPETLEVLDAKGGVFQIDSAAIRALFDPALSKSLYAASEAVALSLGEKLRARRESRGLTQDDLAQRSGLTQEMISNLERGRHQPRFDTLEKYATGLGMTVTSLLGP